MKIKKTVIVLGYGCNNKCLFCCMEDRRKYVKQKDIKEVKNDILMAKKEGTTYLEFVGGEPTIRKDIVEIVKFANKVGFDTIMFTTNGRMLSNKEFTKKILNSGVNHIVFSIHGHNSKLHDSLTRVPGSFEQLISGINNLKELGFTNIGSNTTIVKQNYKNLLDIAKLIFDLGITNSEFIFVDPTHGPPKNKFHEIVPSYEEVSPVANKVLGFAKKNNISHWKVRYCPLCFIDEQFHDMVSESQEVESFHTEHIAPDFVNKDVEKSRGEIGRMKLEKCRECKYANKCEGYWKEYVENYQVEKMNEYNNFKNAFRPHNCYLLNMFEKILISSLGFDFELSTKVENGRQFSSRVNLWFYNDFENNFNTFVDLLKQVNNTKEFKICFELLDKAFNGLSSHNTSVLIFGIDLRDEIKDSRLKLWTCIKEDKEKIDEILKLHKCGDDVLNLLLNNKLLFGIDFFMDGRTRIKIYPYFNRKYLDENKDKLISLGIFDSKCMPFVELSESVHVSFKEDCSNKIFHFHPINPKSFIKKINSPLLDSLNKRYNSIGHNLSVLSLLQKELSNNEINNFNVYY